MKPNIHPSLKDCVVDIDLLSPLSGNPRVGDVEAIMASYSEFGQVKPVIVKTGDDGGMTVIAGNHSVEAARRLGWDKIAVFEFDGDDRRALAFAIADNRTMELGYTDPDLLSDIISEISFDYVELLNELQYDSFELAAIETHADKPESILDKGYIAPVLVNKALEALVDHVDLKEDDDGVARIEAKPTVNVQDAVIGGSTVVGASGSSKAIIQYTLVFDDAEQQKRWYHFIRWLRNSQAYDGETTAERLMSFIDAHSEV